VSNKRLQLTPKALMRSLPALLPSPLGFCNLCRGVMFTVSSNPLPACGGQPFSTAATPERFDSRREVIKLLCFASREDCKTFLTCDCWRNNLDPSTT
jgi:hypothetical protein